MTRRELLDDFLLHVGDVGDATSRNAAESYLNRAITTIWMAHAWRDHVLPDPVQITTVANQRTYALPSYFGRVVPWAKELRNLSTGGRLTLRNRETLEQDHPEAGSALEQAGTPLYGYLGGHVGVRVQPDAAGQALEVVSSDAADIDVRVLIEGVDSTGEWNETQVTLNGTTAVGIGTWKPPIVRFGKSYPEGTTATTEHTTSRGTVTLRVAAAGATLQILLPEESAREFPSLTLYPKPAAAGEIIAVPTIRAPKRLLYDADVVPARWDEAILEQMKAFWLEKAGAIGSAAAVPKPELVKLQAFDNTATAPDPVRKVPFGHVRR